MFLFFLFFISVLKKFCTPPPSPFLPFTTTPANTTRSFYVINVTNSAIHRDPLS